MWCDSVICRLVKTDFWLCWGLLVGLPLLLTSTPDVRADENADVETKRCIQSRTIRRTEVIDDSNVVFHTQGRRIYLNTLPKPCKGLSRHGRFSHVTHMRSLCALDRISVLQEGGTGAYEGRACKLGRFRPMTEEGLHDYFDKRAKKPESKSVEPPPIEDVVDDDAGTD